MGKSIEKLCGGRLSFYDAAAPIVTAESVDMSVAFGASRYGRGGEDDYINCPFSREHVMTYSVPVGTRNVNPVPTSLSSKVSSPSLTVMTCPEQSVPFVDVTVRVTRSAE